MFRSSLSLGQGLPVTLQLAVQRGEINAEQCGGARLVVIFARQNVENVAAFQLIERQRLSGQIADRERRLADLLRQVRYFYLALAERDGALNRVLQFTHVAAPVVIDEPLHGFVADGLFSRAERARVLPGEVAHQEWNIFAPFAQRRHSEANDAQAVVEIVAEAARG